MSLEWDAQSDGEGWEKRMSFLDVFSRADTLQIVIWSFFIGIMIGALSLFYQKQVIGSFVRALLADGAADPGNAKTLEELGYAKNRFVRYALRNGSVLRKMVWEAEDNYTTDESGFRYSARTKKMDINTARFYIDDSNRVRADLRYNAQGSDILVLLISVVIFAVAAYALLIFIPYIVDLFKNNTSGS